MFSEILLRDWNHPCVVIQTIINESWGINLKQPEQRKWLRDAYDRPQPVRQYRETLPGGRTRGELNGKRSRSMPL